MKLLHLLPLLLFAFAPLAPAQEAPTADSVCDALTESAKEIMDKAKEDLKNYLPEPPEGGNADMNYTKKERREDKRKERQLKKEAKKKFMEAQGRASKLKGLATRIKSLDRDSSTINKQSGKGVTTLMTAAAMGEKNAVQWLLDKGADPSLTNKEGQTAADLCENEAIANLIRAKAAQAEAAAAKAAEAPKAEEAKPAEAPKTEETAKPAEAPKAEEAAKPAEEPKPEEQK